MTKAMKFSTRAKLRQNPLSKDTHSALLVEANIILKEHEFVQHYFTGFFIYYAQGHTRPLLQFTVVYRGEDDGHLGHAVNFGLTFEQAMDHLMRPLALGGISYTLTEYKE